MGFPSICCEYVLLPLVNKEANLANSQAEYSQAEILGENIGVREMPAANRCEVTSYKSCGKIETSRNELV